MSGLWFCISLNAGTPAVLLYLTAWTLALALLGCLNSGSFSTWLSWLWPWLYLIVWTLALFLPDCLDSGSFSTWLSGLWGSCPLFWDPMSWCTPAPPPSLCPRAAPWPKNTNQNRSISLSKRHTVSRSWFACCRTVYQNGLITICLYSQRYVIPIISFL
jgi:hypothetical protein